MPSPIIREFTNASSAFIYCAAIIAALILVVQGSFNISLMLPVGSLNISYVDLIALVGLILLGFKLILFPVIIILVSATNIADITSSQAILRDLSPLFYLGTLYYGLILKDRHVKVCLYFSLILLFVSSLSYLIMSNQAWYRGSILTDAELLVIGLLCFWPHLRTATTARFDVWKLLSILMICTIILAQVANGSRAVTIIAAVIILYQLFVHQNIFRFFLISVSSVIVAAVIFIIFRPLSILRILDLFDSSDSHMGSVTVSYRLENYLYLWDFIVKEPFFGNGFGKYLNFSLGQLHHQVHPAWVVHNDYLAIIYYYGFIGSFLLTLYLIIAFRHHFHLRHGKKNSFVIFLIAISLLAISTPVLGNATTGPLFWFFIGCFFKCSFKNINRFKLSER